MVGDNEVERVGRAHREGEGGLEEAVLHISDLSVMFEKGGKVSGFERSAIRLAKPEGDATTTAYSTGNEVTWVVDEPLAAVLCFPFVGRQPNLV